MTTKIRGDVNREFGFAADSGDELGGFCARGTPFGLRIQLGKHRVCRGDGGGRNCGGFGRGFHFCWRGLIVWRIALPAIILVMGVDSKGPHAALLEWILAQLPA